MTELTMNFEYLPTLVETNVDIYNWKIDINFFVEELVEICKIAIEIQNLVDLVRAKLLIDWYITAKHNYKMQNFAKLFLSSKYSKIVNKDVYMYKIIASLI
jgi:hypothetical protein